MLHFSTQERNAKKKPAVDSSQVLTDTSPVSSSSQLKTTDESDLNIEQETDTLIDDYIEEIDSDLKKR
jgi:hypothetical protein